MDEEFYFSFFIASDIAQSSLGIEGEGAPPGNDKSQMTNEKCSSSPIS
jgi:hypothetical protein